MLGKEGDVDDAMLARPALDVKAADVFAFTHRHQPVGLRIIFLVMRMLQLELRVEKRGLLRVGHGGDDSQFLGAGRGIDSHEERQVGIGDGAEGQANIGRADPSERDEPGSVHLRRLRFAAGTRPAGQC